MQLQTGQTISHYRISGTIGRGGMGEVYIAEDTKLSRRVALKILPAEMAADADRRGRFEREAKAIAALNHPNIVTIHSIEEADGVHFLTMELIEGETLAQMIARGRMDLARLLHLGLELAEAMAAAHRQGITHRDLKPDNMMLGADGRLKILDFGLAKLREEAAGMSAASEMATREVQTEEGKIVGTVAYMSPEQAEGKQVDSRSDIFSIGIILYEMSTGERPFKGDTRISTISSILRDTPASVTELNSSLPRHLGRIVRRCLAKDPERRYGNSRELYNDLLELKDELDSGEIAPVGASASGDPAGVAAVPARRASPLVLGLSIVAGLAIIAVVILSVMKSTRRESDAAAGGGAAPLQATFTQLTNMPGSETHPSLSPDGRMLVYTSRSGAFYDIFFQVVGGQKRINLTEGSNSDNGWPAFSPDGTHIAFASTRGGGGLYVMGTTGESVRRLTDRGFSPSWTPDGTEVLYSTQGFITPFGRAGEGKIRAVHVDSGVIRDIPHDGDAVQPMMSPNGLRIAFWGLRPGGGIRDIWTIPAEGGETVPVTSDEHTDWNPVWSPDGRHLYYGSTRSGSVNIWRVPIDEEMGRILGSPEAVTTGVSSTMFLTAAADGRTMAYVSMQPEQNIQKIVFDPDAGEPIGEPTPITRGAQVLFWASVSPDGEWVAATRGGGGGQEDIHLVKSDGNGRRQLTDDPAKDRGATWSPDGSEIAYYSDRSGSYEIWCIRPDGSGQRQITDTPELFTEMPVWSPDGNRLAVSTSGAASQVLRGMIIDPHVPFAEQTPNDLPPFEGGTTGIELADWSPDGNWLAASIRKTQLSGEGIVIYSLENKTYEKLTDFGEYPRWLSDNRRLLFVERGEIYLVDRVTKETRKALSVLPDTISQLRFSRDGRTMVYSRIAQNNDIWLMTLE